jgi:hypothetical protein
MKTIEELTKELKEAKKVLKYTSSVSLYHTRDLEVERLATELYNLKRNTPVYVTIRMETDLDTAERMKAELEEDRLGLDIEGIIYLGCDIEYKEGGYKL